MTLGATTLGSVAALAALALAATALPARAATFVYVGCTDSNEIYVLQSIRRPAVSPRSRR